MSDNHEEENSNVPAYVPAKHVSVDQLKSQDADDEALKRYKESLLGQTYAPADDSRKLVIKEMRIKVEGQDKDIVYPLDTPELIKAMKNQPFSLKEGCNYKISLTFNIQHDIVSGLKQVNKVYRKGIRVNKEELMLGSFAPQAASHTVTNPRNGWTEAPSGMLARGSYTADVTFTDDDKQEHLCVEYAFSIDK